jgi:PhnB protein
MEFYKSVFGGKLDISRFKDMQAMPNQDPADDEKVMHSTLETDDGFTIMGSDTPSSMEYTDGARVSVSVSGEEADEEKLRGYYEKLCEGGKEILPMNKAPWGDSFGMCDDKFGIHWLVNIAGPKDENGQPMGGGDDEQKEPEDK